MPASGGANKGDHDRIRRKIPSFATALSREWKSALRKHGDWWFGRMADRFRAPLTPYGSPNPHSTLHSRTGAMRNSLHKAVAGTKLSDLSLRMWSDHPGARLQEYGGIVRPRKGTYLAIPIDDNLTPAGAPRFRSPRQIPDGRFLEPGRKNKAKRGRDGRLFFVLDTEDDTKFLFALRKEVDIPGPGPLARRKGPSRLGMRDTAIGVESKRTLRRRIIVGTRRAIQASFRGGPSGG